MASITDRLTSDMKSAMRSREQTRLDAIRWLLSTLKNAQIEARRPLDDDEEIAVVRKQAKMRRDALDQYRKAGRDDLVSKEEIELALTESYLPAAPSAEQLRAAVRAVIAETGASGPKDMSAVMRVAMARLGGTADGRQVQGIVREELAARGG